MHACNREEKVEGWWMADPLLSAFALLYTLYSVQGGPKTYTLCFLRTETEREGRCV